MNKKWLLSVVLFSKLLDNTTLATTQLDTLVDQQTTISQQLQKCLSDPTTTPSDLDTLTKQNQALTEQIKAEALASSPQPTVSSPDHQSPIETPERVELIQNKPLPENENQQKIVHNTIQRLFEEFIPSLLSEKDKVILEEQRLLFTMLEKALPQIALQTQVNDSISSQYIALLIFVCTQVKEVQVKTELLATNLLEKPFTIQQIIHLQIKTLQYIGNNLREAWHQIQQGQDMETVKERCFANDQISAFLLHQLHEELYEKPQNESWLTLALTLGIIKVYHAKQSDNHLSNQINNTIKPLLTCDIYQIDPIIFDEYLSLIKQYRTSSYTQPNQELKKFIMEIDRLAQAYENKIHSITQERLASTTQDYLHHLYEQKILELFINKLFSIKSYLMDQHPELSDATATGIWLRYVTIATNPVIQNLITRTPEIADFFNAVQKSITNLMKNPQLSPQAVCELLFITNKLQKYLKYHEESTTSKLFHKPDAAYLLVSEMASLLENINAYLLRTTQDPFIKEILTFAFIEPQSSAEEPMGPGKKIIVEAAQQITGQKFTNVRDVFLHALGYVSPWAAATVLSWAMPYLAEEVKQPIVSFFAQQQKSQQPVTKESLIQLSTQNPQLLPALEKLGPELATQALTLQQNEPAKAISEQSTPTL